MYDKLLKAGPAENRTPASDETCQNGQVLSVSLYQPDRQGANQNLEEGLVMSVESLLGKNIYCPLCGRKYHIIMVVLGEEPSIVVGCWECYSGRREFTANDMRCVAVGSTLHLSAIEKLEVIKWEMIKLQHHLDGYSEYRKTRARLKSKSRHS